MKEFSDITYEDLKRFASAKITQGGLCPTCGTNNWWTEPSGNVFMALPVASKSSTGELSKGLFPVFSMSCSNCGYISLHMIAAVKRWLNEVEPTLPGT